MTDDRATFWKRLEGVTAGMLGCAPDWRLVPMTHHPDPQAGALWFITAEGVELEQSVRSGAQKAVHAVADGEGKLYARIEGRLELSRDQAKLDEVWGAVASAWFDNGERQEDARLLKLTISAAEVWTTTGNAGFLYEIAKAKITGAKPDMGEHFQVSFA